LTCARLEDLSSLATSQLIPHVKHPAPPLSTLAAVPPPIAEAPTPAQRPQRAIHVVAGDDRFSEQIHLGDAPNDCKVSGHYTEGTWSIFESTMPHQGGPPLTELDAASPPSCARFAAR